MAEDVICSVKRTGVTNPIARNIIVQISKMRNAEVDPFLYVQCYTTMLPLNNPQLILFNDYIVDQVVVDAITGNNRAWQIVNDPTMDVVTGDWKFSAIRVRERVTI